MPPSNSIPRAGSAPPSRGCDHTAPIKPLPPKNKIPHCSDRVSRTIGLEWAHNPSIKKGGKKNVKKTMQPPKDPFGCSLAMSRAESLLVTSSGDVLVCRCRRSSTPYISKRQLTAQNALVDPWICCDTALNDEAEAEAAMATCMTEGPWTPVFSNLTNTAAATPTDAPCKQVDVTSSYSHNSDVSTYEWEHKQPKPKAPQHLLRRKPGLHGGEEKSPQQESPSSPASLSPTTSQAPTVLSIQSLDDFEDATILPLPSFDYSHIDEGMNDMLLTTREQSMPPPSSRRRRSSSLSSQHPPNSLTGSTPFPTILESPPNSPSEAVEKPCEEEEEEVEEAPFFHGIPTFLSTLSQIKIAKLSAHPLGAHVLAISTEALLFTYGLNNHGQLGIGVKSSIKDERRGFHTQPTLVTPLLENGGKTLHCAAGVDHSLVVVGTEGRRLHKFATDPNKAHSEIGVAYPSKNGIRKHHSHGRLSFDGDNENEDQSSVQHHQIYGFGSNEYMKIGLVSANLVGDGSEGDVEDILLPHRVALHCTVWPESESSTNLPPQGVFDIAASAEHSAALVRRATGDIECYMWGNATVGALGLPGVFSNQKGGDQKSYADDASSSSGNSAKKDAEKAQSRQKELRALSSSSTRNIFPLPTVLESLSYRAHKSRSMASRGYPHQLSLGPYCSFVVMSTGRCSSFGFSAEGMLGQGYGVTHSMEPKDVFLPVPEGKESNIASISAGAFHVVAICKDGKAYSWGFNADDRLGLGTSDFLERMNSKNSVGSSIRSNKSSKSQKSSKDAMIEWVPQEIDVPKFGSQSCPFSDDSQSMVIGCAGYDSSMLVARSGQVLCFGKRSGRLGKGEVSKDVGRPQPLHGGLQLFYDRKRLDEEQKHQQIEELQKSLQPKPRLSRRQTVAVPHALSASLK